MRTYAERAVRALGDANLRQLEKSPGSYWVSGCGGFLVSWERGKAVVRDRRSYRNVTYLARSREEQRWAEGLKEGWTPEDEMYDDDLCDELDLGTAAEEMSG